MMRFSSVFTLLCSLLTFLPLASGKGFLSSEDLQEDMNVSDMLAVLLSEKHTAEASNLPAAVRSRHETDGHATNQETLRAMFDALPKSDEGHIGLSAARYVLHRLFEDRHRWFVHGLHPTKNASGSSSEVGKALQNLGESDVAGLDLLTLASLASTLEELIQGELATHLSDMYAARSQQNGSYVPGSFLKEIAYDYLTIYISGADFAENSRDQVADDEAFMRNNTKDWNETQEWLYETIATQFKAESSCKSENVSECKFDFDASLRVLKHVVENYGFFNDRECRKVKSALLEVEVPRTGRVKLADFYRAGLSGAWSFNEKIEYLRALGALDESVPSQPKVIVANYVSSWVNCLSPSKFYSVCCRNECEDYMKTIETKIGGPTSDVDTLFRLIQSDAMFKADASSNFYQLKQRLTSIADKNGGSINIHGRLFAQWMHHVFPRTCPFPHESGTTNPMTPDDWLAETGHENIQASAAEVQQILDKQQGNATAGERDEEREPVEEIGSGELPWSDTEELLVVRPVSTLQAKSQPSAKGTIVLEVLVAFALLSFVYMLASSWREIRKSMRVKNGKHIC
jgi:hypothetical protein